MDPLSEEQERIRELLLNHKKELEKRVASIHSHARNPLDADSGEQAAQLGNVAVVSALEKEATAELADIRSALQRLEAGNYGICTSCGGEISSGRLQVRPASAECVDCAELGPAAN
ncbi:MAG: TraR/DksA family transcriptional regulator [Gammaproteobacteria bacterium]|nr:TraR/DksA family transcriptional regulator [Gammaproteobacteria bacterium]